MTASPTHCQHTYGLDLSLGVDQELHEAAPTLLLRTIDIILNGTTPITRILDSGCQVVIICQDIWEKLGVPLKQDWVMFMELANGQSYVAIGTLLRIQFTIGQINLYCTVHIVQEAPFECLIGQPLTTLAQTVS